MFRAQVEDSAQTVCCDSHDDRGTNAEGKDEKRGYQFGAWARKASIICIVRPFGALLTIVTCTVIHPKSVYQRPCRDLDSDSATLRKFIPYAH